ncbi:transposase [Clostridium sp. 'White wine YQ']|uniref:transposase n=1 Tax=Clostridium sp. 'White wine YQ' TaxID=3027474 RepID=UPI002367320A|nr:transposase [Clostridium sp. 'White wine YQ']MDD7796311.1 transposase [Clostridium sp. 'White wine YQ']
MKNNYSIGFKIDAVQRFMETNEPLNKIAKEIGVHTATLNNWIKTYPELVADISTKPKDKNFRKLSTSVELDANDFTKSNLIENDDSSIDDLLSSYIEEAGKNISVYLSSKTLKLLNEYKKKKNLNSRSRIIDAIVYDYLSKYK